jgi:hypothetical protein
MIDPYNSTAEYLLKELITRVEKYASSGNESARVAALDQCLKLSRALEKPKEAVLKLSLSVILLLPSFNSMRLLIIQPVLFMAVKVGHDLGIFAKLVYFGPTTVKDLAAAQDADPALVGMCELTGSFYCSF